MVNRFSMKMVSLFTAVVIAVSGFGGVVEASVAKESLEQKVYVNEPDFGQIKKVLEAIEKIPYDVVYSGSDAMRSWYNENTEIYISEFPTRGFWGCVGAIGAALIVPAKILKIKKIIDAFGGVMAFIDALRWAFEVGRERGMSVSEAIEYAVRMATEMQGEEVYLAVLGVIGVGEIAEECFDE